MTLPVNYQFASRGPSAFNRQNYPRAPEKECAGPTKRPAEGSFGLDFFDYFFYQEKK